MEEISGVKQIVFLVTQEFAERTKKHKRTYTCLQKKQLRFSFCRESDTTVFLQLAEKFYQPLSIRIFVNPQREYERKNAFASTVQTETMYILIFTTSRQALSVSFTDAYVW